MPPATINILIEVIDGKTTLKNKPIAKAITIPKETFFC
jgi:hypothetical protein